MDDRLYLVEEKDEDEDVDGELVNPQQGRRIFATSLQGDTLQVYTRVRTEPSVSRGTRSNLSATLTVGSAGARPRRGVGVCWGSAPGWSLSLYLAHHSRALRWAVFAPPTPPLCAGYALINVG